MIFVFFIAAIISSSLIPEGPLYGLPLIFTGLFLWFYSSLGSELRLHSWVVSLFAAYAIIRAFSAPDSMIPVYIAQPMILWFVLSWRFPIEPAHSSNLSQTPSAIIGIIMAFDLIAGFSGGGLFGNPNNAGAMAALAIIAVLSSSVGNASLLVRFFAICASAFVVVDSGSRGALLFLAVYLAVAYVRPLRRLFSNRVVFCGLLFTAASSPFFFDIYEPYFDPAASSLILGKPLETGRQIIWPLLLDQFWLYPVFGYGRTDPGYLLDADYFGLSAHNLYLQTAFEFGSVGLALLMLVFIVQHARLDGPSAAAFHGRALLCAVLVREMFEVSLTENNFSFGILIWSMLARFEALKEQQETDHNRMAISRTPNALWNS